MCKEPKCVIKREPGTEVDRGPQWVLAECWITGKGKLIEGHSGYWQSAGSESESESELLLVTRSNDNHSPGPVMREVSP